MTPSSTRSVSTAPLAAEAPLAADAPPFADATRAPLGAGGAPRKFGIDQRYIAPLFISCILFGAQISFGVLESFSRTALAIVTSVVMEIILSKMTTGKFPHLASAYVSGISVGILVRSPEFWPYALCAMIAITSKYVIRVKGRHIWNPSNFAIAVLLIIAHETVSTLSFQWDNRVWAMAIIWTLGSIIIWNLKRFHICAAYVAAFFAFALERAIFSHSAMPFNSRFFVEIAPITGPMYQLFIFFMITDPKTTVHGRRAQMFVAFLVAFAEHILRLAGNIHAPYYALFVVGPITNLVEIWWTSRNQPKQSTDSTQSNTTREPALSTA
jgi:Na+-translocating ferredoxin:NAD+ oxidoreductase RnfD subunit